MVVVKFSELFTHLSCLCRRPNNLLDQSSFSLRLYEISAARFLNPLTPGTLEQVICLLIIHLKFLIERRDSECETNSQLEKKIFQ